MNIRTPLLPGGGQVRLKERKQTVEAPPWDNQITLQSSGSRPAVCAVEIVAGPRG